MLTNMEPLEQEAGVLIFDENSEVNEVIFFEFGHYGVGFELNKKVKIAIRVKYPTVIGAYELTSLQRTEYLYKTLIKCEGFFIRRQNWKMLFDNHEEIADQMAISIKRNYDTFKRPVAIVKNKEIEKLNQRADIDFVF